jgi:hypothetical protein
MDITKILFELRSQLQQLDEAILVIQRLAAGQGKRRGRPPKWMAQVRDREPSVPVSSASVRKRKSFSAATRKEMAAAQKRRWAERKAKTA